MRVLVVDDYREHVDALVAGAQSYAGCQARGCFSGEDALIICDEWKPHLVIYDGLLDGMRAWEFALDLLEDDPPEKERPYLVALTGFGSTLQRRLCEEVGFDEYVVKPIAPEVLKAWVEEARRKEMFA